MNDLFLSLERNRLHCAFGSDVVSGLPVLLSLIKMSPVVLCAPTHELVEATVLRTCLAQFAFCNDASHFQLAFAEKDTAMARFFARQACVVSLEALLETVARRKTAEGKQLPYGLMVLERIERFSGLQQVLPTLVECGKYRIAVMMTTTWQSLPDFCA